MNNFSERLNKLQEAAGLEKTNFSQSYVAFLYDDGSGDLVTAMTKYDGKSDMKKVALDFINKGLDGDDLAKESDIKMIQKFDDHDKAEEWMDDEGRKYEHKNFSDTELEDFNQNVGKGFKPYLVTYLTEGGPKVLETKPHQAIWVRKDSNKPEVGKSWGTNGVLHTLQSVKEIKLGEVVEPLTSWHILKNKSPNKVQYKDGELVTIDSKNFSDTELEDFAKKIKSAKSKLSKDDDLDPKFADTLFEKAKEMGFEFELANGDIKKLIQDPGYVKDIIKADPKNGPGKVERLVQFMLALKNGGSMNFSEDQGVDTQVTDEASARALGESLAKKMWGDKFDQNIFDGVFATALEQCGENWNHVAAYLRKVYQGANKMDNFGTKWAVKYSFKGPDGKTYKYTKYYNAESESEAENKFNEYWKKSGNSLVTPHIDSIEKKAKGPGDFRVNFSERLNSLQESVGLEKTKLETQTPAVATTATPATETPSAQAEVTRTQEGSSTPAPVQPANLSKKPKTETKETVTEAICPKCGRVPCECVTHTVTLDFSNLTDEEFAEIANEAKEYAKYPEQYETEGDRIQSFASWLQNSRFKDFCNEALYKAFCGLKK